MVHKAVRPKLAALKPLAAELNQLSDSVTEELKQVEQELSELNLGLVVEMENRQLWAGPTVAVRSGSWEFEEEVVFLGFGQPQPKRWCLMGRHYKHLWQSEAGQSEEWIHDFDRPLLEEPRHVRLTAAEMIEAFLDHVAGVAKEKIQNLKSVKDK